MGIYSNFYFVGMQEDSLIDFPPYISVVFYVHSCMYRCAFCFNKSIVENSTGIKLSQKEAIERLEEINSGSAGRIVDGVVISGGEPLIHTKDLKGFLELLKLKGYKVKMDTTLTGGNIGDLIPSLDGVSFSLKTDTRFFERILPNIKKVTYSAMPLKELRLILTRENNVAMKQQYLELLNQRDYFVPTGWKLHIDRAIKGDEWFSPFTVLEDDEFERLRDSWPGVSKFAKLTWK